MLLHSWGIHSWDPPPHVDTEAMDIGAHLYLLFQLGNAILRPLFVYNTLQWQFDQATVIMHHC